MSTNTANTTAEDEKANPEEKTCRICLDGEDPEMGRLIRPCLCRGTISYVHVKCLQRWRNASTSQSAFYACPQCHYKYAFARTRALGIASNPIFVGMLSAFFFTCLVFGASFIATFYMGDVEDSRMGSLYFYHPYWVSPYDIARDLMKMAYRVLRDEDIIMDNTATGAGVPPRPQSPQGPSGPLAHFIRRFILGLPVVGVVSVVHLLYTMSLLGPMNLVTRWRGMRTRGNRRDSSRDIATLLIMIAIIGGAIRALWKVYRLTERFAKRVLLRAEDAILEVNV